MTAPLIAVVVLLLLCFAGVRIGVATLLVGFFGFALERGIGPAMQLSGQRILDDAMNYNLSVIPLFILMGVFIFRAEISGELYAPAQRRFSKRHGSKHAERLSNLRGSAPGTFASDGEPEYPNPTCRLSL